MKRIVFIVLLAVFATSLSAQKAVRKSIRKGNKAFKEQRYSAAEEDYAKAMEGDASSKEASFNLANTYYKQQRYDEAIEEYKHYLTLESEAPEKMSAAWSNMGNTFLKKKAGEKSQMMAQAQAGNAQQQQQADNLKMSMEAYKNALRLNPLDDETRENLAIVQKMIKDQEGGEGEDNKDDQNEDKKEDKEDKKEEPKKDEQKEQQQNENQMSQENMQQILEAIEQDERETQERVNQHKAEERKKKNERNRQQDKDW